MAARLVEGGRRRVRRTYRPMSEINVTPFVDVMLVLLVVFMITAPLLSVGVPVDLPESQARPLQGSDEPLTVTIDNAGKVYLQEIEVSVEELAPKLVAVARTRQGANERIVVRGDRAIAYGVVMQVMGTLSAAGFTHVALETAKPKQSVSKR